MCIWVFTTKNRRGALTDPILTRCEQIMRDVCAVVAVGLAQVGVVVRPGRDDRFDQWSAYWHPDGVVVYVAQRAKLGDDRPGLTALPLSVPQLAVLAVDERFHLR